MRIALSAVVLVVMIEHVWFLVLEMFLFIQAVPALVGLALAWLSR